MSCAHGAYLSFQVATLSSRVPQSALRPPRRSDQETPGLKPITRVIICARAPSSLRTIVLRRRARRRPRVRSDRGLREGSAAPVRHRRRDAGWCRWRRWRGGEHRRQRVLRSPALDRARRARRLRRRAPGGPRRAATVTLAVDAGAVRAAVEPLLREDGRRPITRTRCSAPPTDATSRTRSGRRTPRPGSSTCASTASSTTTSASTRRTRRARRSTTGRASTRSTTPSSRRACARWSRSASRPARWRPTRRRS